MFKIKSASCLSEHALPPCGHKKPRVCVYDRSNARGALEMGSKTRNLAWWMCWYKAVFVPFQMAIAVTCSSKLNKATVSKVCAAPFRHGQSPVLLNLPLVHYRFLQQIWMDCLLIAKNVFWVLGISMGKINTIFTLVVPIMLWALGIYTLITTMA